MGDATALGPDERVEDRPFTDPEHTVREAGVMQVMLGRERDRAKAWATEDPSGTGHVAREHDEQGFRHLFVVTDTRALLETTDLTAVGFFGRPRDDVGHEILFDLEQTLVDRMGTYGAAGLLSYYDVELVKGAYGNLILFSTPDVPPEWHGDEIHRRAVEVSPQHYHEVRLHKGSIRGRLLDGGDIVIERTKYFDFAGGSLWQAVRHFGPDSA
ncbi:MAG: hypothetical protein E6G67_00345 [Actinobacteria bacterium]|nr:MAG: hypothetical protein E6G67_00345 [Actinomycetota bacterium]